ncbi:MAG: YdeI family protein [Fimbriimonas sp.]
MEAIYFDSPSAFENWLEENHASASEVLVGFYKAGTGKPTLTWPESVDVALCFGWIDGIRRRIDDQRYTIRFTPRRAKSNWSEVNVRRVAELLQENRMRMAGMAAFEARAKDRGKHYSYENMPEEFPDSERSEFAKNEAAWEFFCNQPRSYRRRMIWWVVSGKRSETRAKRLAELIEYSKEGLRHPRF